VRRVVRWLDERGRIDDDDEPGFYQPLIDAWERLGSRLAAQTAPLEG
jgi:hypothetical protein